MPKVITLPPFPKPVFGVYNQWGREPGQIPYAGVSVEKFIVGYRTENISGRTRMNKAELMEVAVDQWRRRCLSLRRSALTLEDVLVGRTFTAMLQTRYGTVTFMSERGELTLSPTRGWLYGTVSAPDGSFTVERVLKTHRSLRLVGGGRIEFPKKMGIYGVDPGIVDDIYGPLIENSD